MNYLFVLISVIIWGSWLQAAAPPPLAQKPPPPREREIAGGPYCGVYSAYGALRAVGIEVQFEDLLDNKYVGSFYGSTAAELKQAIVDSGGYCEAMEGLTASALRNSSFPIILHVRRPGLKTDYAHWILYLGVQQDKARIVDPPNSVELLPFAELLSLWDGTGLVVSKSPISTWWIQGSAWFESIVLLLLIGAVLGGFRIALDQFRMANHRLRCLYVLPALILIGFCAALITHSIHDEGLLANRAAVGQIVLQHFEPELPSVTYQEIKSLAHDPDVVFLDARFPEGYQMGHLPRAVNLPVYAGLVERSEILAKINPRARVIVYCQSEKCSWGEIIAADLMFRGYTNVELYPGGYKEWAAHESAKPSR